MSDQDTRLLSQLGQATLTRTRACPKRSTGPHSWAWDEAIEAYRCLDCGAREADDTPRECDFAPQSDARVELSSTSNDGEVNDV